MNALADAVAIRPLWLEQVAARRHEGLEGVRSGGAVGMRTRTSVAGGRASRVVAAMLLWLVAGLALAQEAPQAADDFLKLVDARQYGESWDAASDYLKQSVSRSEWATQLVKARETIGDLGSRKRIRVEPQSNPPGAPAGEYLLVTYETVFASQGAARTETLPLVKGADGRWRAVGYFVR